MLTLNLDQQMSGQVFPFLIVFARLGSTFMLFPGIGEAFVPPRLRLIFALAVGFILVPVLAPHMAPPPRDAADFALLVMKEILIGLYLGSIMRLLTGTIEVAGSVIAFVARKES